LREIPVAKYLFRHSLGPPRDSGDAVPPMEEETRWLELLEEERQARAALKEPELGEPPDTSALRRWWSAVAGVLRAMVRRDGNFTGKPPMELFHVLGRLAEYLARGQVPETIAGVATKGRTSPGPTEEYHIRIAVTYRRAVEQKLICDPHPTKSIMMAYELRSRRVVQKWCERYEPLDLALWAHIPDALAKKMWSAGEAYRKANQRTWASGAKGKRARGERK
jgi:hypothetical protein